MQNPDGQIQAYELTHFITLVGEKLVIATRKHWFVLALPITIILFGAFVFSVLTLVLFSLLPLSSKAILFTLTTLVIVTIIASFITKAIVDWYCHFYIVTTRKILEVCHAPLSSSKINEVLLDQVRCTEVDVKVSGMLEEFIEMGDVIVTFDRPTHQEEFVLHDIQNPRNIGLYLSDMLESTHQHQGNPFFSWYKMRDNNNNSRFRLREEIFPKHSEGGTFA